MDNENYFEKLLQWCIITDNTPQDATPHSKAYLKLDQIIPNLFEEVKELEEASELVDDLETLDAVIDIHFVHMQAMTALIQAGFDVDGAFQAVCENNMLKFTTAESQAYIWWDEHMSKDDGELYEVFRKEISEVVWYGVKRVRDGKIMKPVGHPKVDLTPFLPKV